MERVIWVTSASAESVRRARVLLVASILGGLIQKPLIKFAWDVQAFTKELVALHKTMVRHASAGPESFHSLLIGGTAILLRQIFATVGQRRQQCSRFGSRGQVLVDS